MLLVVTDEENFWVRVCLVVSVSVVTDEPASSPGAASGSATLAAMAQMPPCS